jgi:hypothetical protein
MHLVSALQVLNAHTTYLLLLLGMGTLLQRA